MACKRRVFLFSFYVHPYWAGNLLRLLSIGRYMGGWRAYNVYSYSNRVYRVRIGVGANELLSGHRDY